MALFPSISVLILAVYFCVGISSCQPSDGANNLMNTSDPSQPKLGLNDVSWLFPYVDLPELLSRAPMVHEARGDGGRFIPETALEQLNRTLVSDHRMRLGLEGPEGQGASNPDLEERFFSVDLGGFSLAAIRIDPCANKLAGEDTNFDGDCRFELRAVWQRMRHEASGLRVRDANIHTIYELSKREFLQLLTGLQRVKRLSSFPSSLDQPLGPQPMILAEGKDSDSFDRLVKLFESFADLDHLKAIAALADTAPTFEGHWPMLALDYENGRLQPRTLGFVRPSATNQGKDFFVQRVPGAFQFLGTPRPIGKDFPDFNPFKEDGAIKVFEGMQRLGDPRVHGVENTDCASCHMSHTSLRPERYPENFAMPQDGFYQNPRWNLENRYEQVNRFTSLQIFSFFAFDYAIAPRAVYESAVVADRVATLLSRNHPEPEPIDPL